MNNYPTYFDFFFFERPKKINNKEGKNDGRSKEEFHVHDRHDDDENSD